MSLYVHWLYAKVTKYTIMYVKMPKCTLACTWNTLTVQCNVHQLWYVYINVFEIAKEYN